MDVNISSHFSWKFPLLFPRVADSLWFSADKPCDDENELTQMEADYQNWVMHFVVLFITALMVNVAVECFPFHLKCA